jgi:hypothetical protein
MPRYLGGTKFASAMADALLMNWPLFGQFIFMHQPRSRSRG